MIRYDVDYGFSGFDYTRWDYHPCPFEKFLSLTQDLDYFCSLGYSDNCAADALGLPIRMFRFIKRRRVKDLKLAVACMCVELYDEGRGKREISRLISQAYSDVGYTISPQSVVNYIKEYPHLLSTYERERSYMEHGVFGFQSVQKNLLVL